MRFWANDSVVDTDAWGLAPALDFIRKDLGLTGTKEGCREGDCGACSVLVGGRAAESGGRAGGAAFSYRAMPSCLLALGELEGKHLVTIEGLAAAGQTPVMRALAEANGSQCGFCSPGFVISLTGYLIGGGERKPEPLSVEGAFSAIEGNLCRCTGYGSIKRAAAALVAEFANLPLEPAKRLEALVAAGVVPASAAAFAAGDPRLARGDSAWAAGDSAWAAGDSDRAAGDSARRLFLGGGTDFLVRNPDPAPAAFPAFELLDRRADLKKVEIIEKAEGRFLELGAALSWREFFSEPKVLALIPGIDRFEKLLASPLVRERATLGGNIANASPVGDVTAMLIALGAIVKIAGADVAGRQQKVSPRALSLERLFLGYKKLDLANGEIIASILIPASREIAAFNFEKASKREKLDIAAVNTAAAFETEDAKGETRIARARISAGGVAPVPLYLEKASAFLDGKLLDTAVALEAASIARAEAAPISDVRGGADYRSRLLERLVLAHFLRLFPGLGLEEAIA